MNIIYLHGFRSHPLSFKGQLLKQYLEQNLTSHQLHLPDLNIPPLQVWTYLSELIEKLDHVVLIGSSFGGFYATQLLAKYAVPVVLINPTVKPWLLFENLFGQASLPYFIHEQWSLDQQQLFDLENMAQNQIPKSAQVLLLLQQGDEVLDYRQAQRYYTALGCRTISMIETQGNHAMHNFSDKIPMILQFLSDSIK